jgi:hypothetical protein
MLCWKNKIDFVKKCLFSETKSSETGHAKTALAAKVANFF